MKPRTLGLTASGVAALGATGSELTQVLVTVSKAIVLIGTGVDMLAGMMAAMQARQVAEQEKETEREPCE